MEEDYRIVQYGCGWCVLKVDASSQNYLRNKIGNVKTFRKFDNAATYAQEHKAQSLDYRSVVSKRASLKRKTAKDMPKSTSHL